MTGDPLEPFRGELRAQCYRMMGSLHDAEDVLQEVSVRVWRGRPDFEGRSSLRTWMHRVAVNACLNELDRKERRVLPMDVSERASGDAPMREASGEVLWMEPYPDDPELGVAERESVELAFATALQRLAPNQRAALLLFDVLGFSGAEIAELMGTTRASVNSALQRARTTLADAHVTSGSQQAAVASLGSDGQRELLARYTAALRDHDVEALLAILTEDATWAMPPLVNWYAGSTAIAAFLTAAPFHVDWRHRVVPLNGQLAIGCYVYDPDADAYSAYALDVLTVRGDRVAGIVSFIDGSKFPGYGLALEVPA